MSDAVRRHGARAALGALRYRLTGHRMPLAATLVLTHRCNALCAACALPLRYRPELDTHAWVGIIDELAKRGAVRVGFTGGEALTREDLPTLVDRCAAHGMWTTLETNGYAYPERAAQLARLDRVMFAWEGREAVHDQQREPGAWRRVEAAIACAEAMGKERSLVTTLTRLNLDEVPYVVERAERAGAEAVFQLLHPGLPNAPSNASELAPAPDALRKVLRWLLEARIAGRPVGMSEKVLRYLLAWPELDAPTSRTPREELHCVAGHLHVAIDPDGGLLPCTLTSGGFASLNLCKDGFEAAFDRVRDNPCRACTSTPHAEYNFLFNLEPAALYERGRSALRWRAA